MKFIIIIVIIVRVKRKPGQESRGGLSLSPSRSPSLHRIRIIIFLMGFFYDLLGGFFFLLLLRCCSFFFFFVVGVSYDEIDTEIFTKAFHAFSKMQAVMFA